ncbi:MAG: hypothetical protein ACN4GW_20630 [Desulforhopalus sp.]
MKTIICLVYCLLIVFCNGNGSIQQVEAKNIKQGPSVTLTVEDTPLEEVLEILSKDTGKRFNLNGEWKDYPVSTSIDRLPLEQGLKRLLRSLNHTIIWEPDGSITIKIVGEVAPKITRPDTSPAMSIPTYAEENEPVAEPESESLEQSESADVNLEEEEQVTGGEDDVENPDSGISESTPEEDSQDEPVEEDLIETDVLPEDTTAGSN